MAAIGNITLNDGKATPVAHLFEPARSTSDMAMYEERAAAQYIGFNKLVLTLKRPSGPSNSATRNLHANLRLETPVLETLATSDSGLTPAPTVAYRPMVEVSFTLPERSLKQERKDLRVLLSSFLLSSICGDFVDNFSVPY